MDRRAEHIGAALLGFALTALCWTGSASAHAGEDHAADRGGLSAIEVAAVAAIIIAAGLIYHVARRRMS